MITIEGRRTLPFPLTTVFGRLSDASFLATCLGPLISCEATTEAAKWRLRPTGGIVSGNVDGVTTILERVPESKIRVEQKVKGSSFTAKTEIAFVLSDINGSTEVAWKADVLDKTGLLRMVPGSMIRTTVETSVGEIWADVEAKLA